MAPDYNCITSQIRSAFEVGWNTGVHALKGMRKLHENVSRMMNQKPMEQLEEPKIFIPKKRSLWRLGVIWFQMFDEQLCGRRRFHH